MNWHINYIGERELVKSAIIADTTIPDSIKKAILPCLQEEPITEKGVIVQGSGNYYSGAGSLKSSINSLIVVPTPLIIKEIKYD